MDIIESYGGVMGALVSSLLTVIMNSDPKVVSRLHNSQSNLYSALGRSVILGFPTSELNPFLPKKAVATIQQRQHQTFILLLILQLVTHHPPLNHLP